MPANLDELLRLAHRLLCAAVIAHGDRDALLDPSSTAIDVLAASPEGLRLAALVESRREELEFALLRALMRHPGITLTCRQLREHAWPDVPDVTPNTVDVYVGYLRRKLGADTIRTVRGVGYTLDPDAADTLR